MMHAVSAPRSAWLEGHVHDACLQEVRAFKPGNVSVGAAGHGMSAEDFLRSAAAVAAPLTRRGQRVGVRIEEAIAATSRVVSCNTNLGIVLLMAPLLRAVEHSGGGATARALRQALSEVLHDLDQDDAACAFRAICQAQPGGLGVRKEDDVHSAPSITLREAMVRACAYDGIARAYADDYATVFEIAYPELRQAFETGMPELWAIPRCFLAILAHQGDGHVERKHGKQTSRQVQAQAIALLANWPAGMPVAQVWPGLRALDRAWKSAGINPGTSADLVAATLLLVRLLEADGYNSKSYTGAWPQPSTEGLREGPATAAPGKREWALGSLNV